jgi:NAD(P)-dependent dehydrogenase (short-subunit alcohol dehydrogenase family)
VNDDSPPVALITAADRGTEQECAARLAALGWSVLLGTGDAERAAEAGPDPVPPGGGRSYVLLDVTDDASVQRVADLVEHRFGRLDCLVNSASVRLEPACPRAGTPADVLRRTFETNLFGAVRVTNAMLPLLRRAPVGRIVNVSNELGSVSLIGADLRARPLAFSSSKSALNAATATYASELRRTGIKVNAVDAGGCTSSTLVEARLIVHYATLGPDGPTGGHFNVHGPAPW